MQRSKLSPCHPHCLGRTTHISHRSLLSLYRDPNNVLACGRMLSNRPSDSAGIAILKVCLMHGVEAFPCHPNCFGRTTHISHRSLARPVSRSKQRLGRKTHVWCPLTWGASLSPCQIVPTVIYTESLTLPPKEDDQ